MDVFLLPVGGERYALYCEPEEASPAVEMEAGAGFFRRLKLRFQAMLAEAERERLQGRAERADPAEPASWLTRARRQVMRWVAERIAEQRLLWQLRQTEQATLLHPEDVDAERAIALLRGMLQQDADRHGRWLIVHSLLFIASGVLFFVPGPNMVAYYFAFRLVGHYFSRRGAQNGLTDVTWRTSASGALASLRLAVTLPPVQRGARVHEVARELGLAHLPAFFERMAAVKEYLTTRGVATE